MSWSPLFTRRKQSVIVIAQQNNLLLMQGGVDIAIQFLFAAGDFLGQTGTLTTPDGFEGATCAE